MAGNRRVTEHDEAAAAVKPRFSGREAYQLEPGFTALQIAEAGAVLMARFMNRLQQMEREDKRPLPHTVRFGINDELQLLIRSEIY